MQMHYCDRRELQRGMTIIEVMIALTIGLLISLAVTTVFISIRQSYLQNNAIAGMQENARFALELLTQDLRHAGFFGDIANPADVTITLAEPNDCGNGIYNFSSPSVMLNYGRMVTNPDGITAYNGCALPTTASLPASGSGILLIKRSLTTPPAAIAAGVVYTRANGSQAELYNAGVGTSIAATRAADWEYQPHVYYIDNNGTLYRRYLGYSGGTPAFVSEPLAEGIDAFHIEFGIDMDRDGTPEFFYTPNAGAASDATLDNAVSANIYILARTTTPDNSTPPDTRSYNLGRVTLGPYNDNFHRRVYATTTALKNIRHQVMLN